MNTHYSSLQSEQSILEAGNFVKKNKENVSKAWGVLVKLSIVRILCSRKYSFDDESFSSKWVISFCFPLLSLSNSQKIIHPSRVARISLGRLALVKAPAVDLTVLTNQRPVLAALTNERPAFTWHLCQCWTPGPQTPQPPTSLATRGQSVKARVKSLQRFIIIIKVVSEGKLRASSRKNFTKIWHWRRAEILFKHFQCSGSFSDLKSDLLVYSHTWASVANIAHTLKNQQSQCLKLGEIADVIKNSLWWFLE